MNIFVSVLLVLIAGLVGFIFKLMKQKMELEQKLLKFDDYKDVFQNKDLAIQMLLQSEKQKKNDEELIQEKYNDLEKYKEKIHRELDQKMNESRVEAEKLLVNAKIEARLIKSENEKISIELNNFKSKLADESKSETKKIIEEAKEKAKNIELKANEIHGAASVVAKKLIAVAEEEAEKTKNGALEFQRNFNTLNGVVKSLENHIQGYGDKYYISSNKVIDDLGTTYSHVQAGKDLMVSKSLSEVLIINGLAADCDYVEPERKKTAIEFVLDAFIGKFDSLISNARKSDLGTLGQELTDTFHMINRHGAAFKNARVTDAFLKSKLDEIKFFSLVLSFREQEKEEQRELREQMREEEKAAREIEKAIKEAAEEEKKLNKIIEKLKAELSQASEQEKEKYEEKMKDLQNQLLEAESKNQRAISMAQQTKKGTVYIISNIGSFGENVYKIGMTRRLAAQDRVDELGDASVPFSFDVHAMIECLDAPSLEKELHRTFCESQVNLVNSRKEFFNTDLDSIKKVVSKMGYEVQWTMKAMAAEYRESLFLKKAKEDKKNVA